MFGNVWSAVPRPGIFARFEMSAAARPTPTTPPTRPMMSASPSTSVSTSALEKPSVLSTAISLRRSRTTMLIVFAVTSEDREGDREADAVQQEREVAGHAR